MRTSTATVFPASAVSAPRTAAIGVHHHEHMPFRVPRAARVVKDIVWIAVISMTLASAAVAAGLLDIFVDANLVPLVLGAGLASLTFSVLGLTDRLSGRS